MANVNKKGIIEKIQKHSLFHKINILIYYFAYIIKYNINNV